MKLSNRNLILAGGVALATVFSATTAGTAIAGVVPIVFLSAAAGLGVAALAGGMIDAPLPNDGVKAFDGVTNSMRPLFIASLAGFITSSLVL